MFKKFVILSLIFIVGILDAQQSKNLHTIQKGIEASYLFKLKKADSLFYSSIEQFPESPFGYHYLSQLHLWYYLGSRDEAELLIYKTYSQLAQERTETLLNNYNDSPNFHLLLGQIYTLRALGQLFQDERIGALLSSRNAVSEFEKTLELDSTYYDAYYGIGLFNYVLSFVPSSIKWVIAVAGLDADKEEGLNNMQTAFRNGNLMKTEAAFQLSQMYSDYLAEYDSSLSLLDELTEKYPNNIIFNYEKSVVLIKSHQLNAAEELLLKISDLDYKQFPQTKALIYFQLGNVYFFQNRFNLALIYYKKFIESVNSLDFTGIAHYRMAISYYFMNNELESKHELLLSGQGNDDIEQDVYAKNKSLGLFDKWMSLEREKLIIAQNNLRAGNFQAVIDSLQYSINNFSDKELSNTARVCLAEAFIETDSLNLVLKNLNKINSDYIENENWVLPYSELLFAKIYYLKLNYEKSKEYIESAEENNEYDYQDELSARIVNLKRKLIQHLK